MYFLLVATLFVELTNTIRVRADAIRMSADSLIVFSNTLRIFAGGLRFVRLMDDTVLPHYK